MRRTVGAWSRLVGGQPEILLIIISGRNNTSARGSRQAHPDTLGAGLGTTPPSDTNVNEIGLAQPNLRGLSELYADDDDDVSELSN